MPTAPMGFYRPTSLALSSGRGLFRGSNVYDDPGADRHFSLSDTLPVQLLGSWFLVSNSLGGSECSKESLHGAQAVLDEHAGRIGIGVANQDVLVIAEDEMAGLVDEGKAVAKRVFEHDADR